jgi:hypothetical protein
VPVVEDNVCVGFGEDNNGDSAKAKERDEMN